MIIKTVRKIIISCLLLNILSFCYANHTQSILAHPEIDAYIADISKQYQFQPSQLRALLATAEFRQDILNTIASPAETKPWYFYRHLFVDHAQRLSEGLLFWERHAATLSKAEKQYGIPAQYIVAILGIETLYGKRMGQYRVLDALSTLAFFHPTRTPFFRRELTEFLLLLREHQLNPKDTLGSYAGAMGQAQFMPSNIRRFAVSASSNGLVDLVHQPDDAILSIANYLSQNGWHPGEPIAEKTRVRGKKYQDAIAKPREYLPTWTQAELKKLKIKTIPSLPITQKAVLLELASDKHHKEYWLGFQNFYAITRYNPSVNYAMAVFQLGNRLERLRAVDK